MIVDIDSKDVELLISCVQSNINAIEQSIDECQCIIDDYDERLACNDMIDDISVMIDHLQYNKSRIIDLIQVKETYQQLLNKLQNFE